MGVLERFEKKVDYGMVGACELWTGAAHPEGYGKMYVSGKTKYAHRVSYELYKGAIPKGLQVLHRCDVPACVNPAHLFVGTIADNMRDKQKKGRSTGQGKGEASTNATLTDTIVLRIRELRAEGLKYRAIAEQFGIPTSTVGSIVTRATWKHI
jgi:hypothetical protein